MSIELRGIIVSIRHEVPRYIGGYSLESHNALGYSLFRCYLDLGVLQIGIRAKVIENQGADEEISDGGIPRVIVYGYDGLPMQPPHDPDYVPEPMYPEYIPLEDEHVFLVEEQPLPPVVLPTAESPRYVVESDPEEDLEEYKDDETEDGLVEYPMDGEEDGDDDDGNSSGDDTDDEDEDEEDEDKED
ncbi:hypothetical protein Tco_0887326 [Tanacetum coccineum]